MLTTIMERNQKILLDTVIIVLVLLCLVGDAEAQIVEQCGNIDNAYGPFDYTNPSHFKEKLPRVEAWHFDIGVEQLQGHARKARPLDRLPADIDYTLRAFPNHHRALYTMVRYYLERVRYGAASMRYSAPCYFARARTFAPHDATVVMLEGLYLHKIGETERAAAKYELALQMAPESAEGHYNAGLLYLEMGEDELAAKHANRAYELGFPLDGLRNKLIRAGVWTSSN